MSEKIYLAFCVHSHQPVGNFPSIFEKGARDCYLPLLRILADYPGITMTLHYTGPLWEWFEQNEPEFFELLEKLTARGQVELMGGGFYEPIIPVIPETDARDQIEYMSAYLAGRFGVRPRGMWCAERIWDPGVPKKIFGSGIEYTLLDDSHFLSTGLCPEDIHGYYMTEREGFPLKVFPIDMHLRYLIPFRQPHEVIGYLLHLKAKGVRVATYGDDGEKFGMWPGTFNWVIEQGWLRKFFDEALKFSAEIEIVPLADVVDKFPPNRLIYLPTASYQEMMEWSLFAKQGREYEELVKQARDRGSWEHERAFLRGGIWDNFLAKYPESNLMVKKGLKVSRLVREHGPEPKALKHLLMSQTNCPYWHGLFGGIYISYLRHGVYENLLKSESLIDEKRFGGKDWILESYDYDMDGHEEVLVSARKFNCYLSPHHSASIFALEDKSCMYNFSNILMRHEEIYHSKILNPEKHRADTQGKEPLSIHDIPRDTPEEFKKLLVYDTYPKFSCITHCLEGEPSWEEILEKNTIASSLSADLAFEFAGHTEAGGGLAVQFKASDGSLVINKGYLFSREGRIKVSHGVKSGLDGMWFGLEFNFMVISGSRPLVDGVPMENSRGRFPAGKVELKDEALGAGLVIRSGEPWEVCVVPIECISQSEEGFEKTFQGWSVYLLRKLGGEIPDVTLEVGQACQS
jgi:4-alpha-glucanotransferase